MTVNDLIHKLSSLKPELRECEVKVLAPNEEFFSPDIKFVLNDISKLDLTKENIDFVWLKY